MAPHAPPLPLLLLLLLLAVTAAVTNGEEPCPRTPGPQSTVARLKDQLLSHYVAEEMPPTQGGAALAVEHAVLIKHIPGIYNNLAEVQITVALSWHDSRLEWDPAQYDFLWTILADSTSIWVPFIGVQSHPTNVPEWVDLTEHMCAVTSPGEVMCMLGMTAPAHCLSDYRGWPQDEHNCSFHVGSWMLTSERLFLKDLHLRLATAPGTSWQVQEHGFATTNASVGPDGRARSSTHIWLQLRHREAVMAVAAYAPALALTVMTLSSLWLPSACGERLALVAISVLAHCTVLVYLSWWLEGGARAPRIVVFHRDGLCAAAAALLVLVGARRLQASRRAAPSWLSAGLARLRASPAGPLLLPAAAHQPDLQLKLISCGVPQPAEAPEVDAASPAPDADVEAAGTGGGDGEGDATDGGSDALVATATAAGAASDAEWWGAASVLAQRLGAAGVCSALLAALLRLLLAH
ncbi:neuronal acetylcholine receptor subunit alpha-4-like [Schistocerca cancellata]|uniref:neuronal acetylcholine receptor subunit alpha-4-like n=1 Tax=Schistocerca cancellata TaxID=274614 RepID=UPI002118110B|nr:neuronal acetylcholine receptor subunit alpha-4-like [Schistocerca cancellata]